MILVIGASSFIGVHTVDYLLSKGENVIVTSRNNKFKEHFVRQGVKHFDLDLRNKTDFEKLPKEGIKSVILLAGFLPANSTADLIEDENAATYFEVNTLGTINVLEYCRRNEIKKLITMSSYSDVYNSWNLEKRITEDEPRNYEYSGDHAVYVFSKNAATDTMLYYNEQYNMSNIIFRLPPVYGVGPHGSIRVDGKLKKSGLQIFMDKARTGEDIVVYGDGEIYRDVVYVKEVASALYKASLSDNARGLYNMTSGNTVSLIEQAKIVAEIFSENKLSKVYTKPEIKNNTKSYIFSIEKAAKDFGYNPKFTSFKDMMVDMKDDMDKNKYKELFNY